MAQPGDDTGPGTPMDRQVWRAAPTTIAVVLAFLIVVVVIIPLLALSVLRTSNSLIAGLLLCLTVLSALYAWRFGLHPAIVATPQSLKIRNPLRSYRSSWTDVRSVTPGPDGLRVDDGHRVREAWCVQKGTRALREGTATRADIVATELLAYRDAVLERSQDEADAMALAKPLRDDEPTLVQARVVIDPVMPGDPSQPVPAQPVPAQPEPAQPENGRALDLRTRSLTDDLPSELTRTDLQSVALASTDLASTDLASTDRPEAAPARAAPADTSRTEDPTQIGPPVVPHRAASPVTGPPEPPTGDDEPDLIIRRATLDSIAMLAQLEHEASWSDKPVPLRDLDAGWRRLFAEHTVRIRIAELDGGPVGYLAYGNGEIRRLAVVPGQRRRGIGTRLVTHAERELERGGPVELAAWVPASDPLAYAFGHARGWTDSGARRQCPHPPHAPEVRLVRPTGTA